MPGAERGRRGLILAVVLPAVAAAAAVLLLAGGGDVQAPSGSPARLAAAAERRESHRDLGAGTTRALRPVTADRGRAGVTPSPLEPLDGGVRPAPPEHISIPAAHVDTIIDGVGTTRDGAIRVPGIGRAGWFDGGPRPGEPGRAVIIGHLDTRRGPGLFARVPSLQRDEAIEVTDRRGDVHSYRVVGTAQVPKDRFPTDQVYGGGKQPVLVLVTCGGPYDQGTGYRDNILVFARAA